jgi:hypothetical protein
MKWMVMAVPRGLSINDGAARIEKGFSYIGKINLTNRIIFFFITLFCPNPVDRVA